MKNILLVIGAFLIASCAVAQKGTGSKKAYALFGEALKLHSYQEHEKALTLLEKAINKDAEYIDAIDLKGNILRSLKRYSEAKVAFQRILSLDPDHVYALTDLSQIHFDLQEYDACIRVLNQMLPLVGVGDKRAEVQTKLIRAEFAKYSYNHPVPYDPVNLGPTVNTVQEEYFPGLDIEEKTLYFTRRDGSLMRHNQDEDLYVSDLQVRSDELVWGESRSLGRPINTPENEGAFSASPDGKYLFFTSCSRPGGYGTCDIWFTTRDGNKWTEPANIGKPINSKYWESQPSISADGFTMFFVSNRPGGFGGTDIWFSKKTQNGWSRPTNLGPEINTQGDEQFPFIHNDGKTLYFTSEGLPGMGKSDIFLTRLVGNTWTTPKNLGYPINTNEDEWNFIVNQKGDKAYFSSSGITPNYGGMDIYSIDLYEEARPNRSSYVRGIVFDYKTKKKLKAEIDLFSLKTGKKVTNTFSDRTNGTFLLNLPSNQEYALEVRAPGYLFHSENFSLTETNLDKPFQIKIGLKPIQTDETMVMQNVLFDVDKSVLKRESFVELDVLVNFLLKNGDLRIEIGGHTDNTGSEEHNKTLSRNRAQSVYDYLIGKDIDPSRLTYKGYGSSQSVASNETSEGRSQNRRTEIKIL